MKNCFIFVIKEIECNQIKKSFSIWISKNRLGLLKRTKNTLNDKS